MAEFPAFQLWTDAYLADTTELTTIEHGAYLLLLIAMWRAGGSLPNNDDRLARFCRLTPQKWQSVKPVIMEFMTIDGDQITQGRLQDEIEKARERSRKASTSARAKYRKTNKTPPANATPKHSSEPATTTITINTSSSLRSEERVEQESWWLEFWDVFPNKVGKPAAGKAFVKAIKRVDRETMMAGLDRYVNKTDDRPWCNPSTWLNQDRWADMPATVGRQQPQRRQSEMNLYLDQFITETERRENEQVAESSRASTPAEQHALPSPRRYDR